MTKDYDNPIYDEPKDSLDYSELLQKKLSYKPPVKKVRAKIIRKKLKEIKDKK